MAGAKDEQKIDMGIPNKEYIFSSNNIQKCFVKLTKVNFPREVPNITKGYSYHSIINNKCFVKLQNVESPLWANSTASSVLKTKPGRYLSVDEINDAVNRNLVGDNDTPFLLKNDSRLPVLQVFKEEDCLSDESVEVPCPQTSPLLERLPSTNDISSNSFVPQSPTQNRTELNNKDRIEETDVDQVNADSADEMLFNPFPGLFFLKHYSNKPNVSTCKIDCARLNFMECKYVGCNSDGGEKGRYRQTLINKLAKLPPIPPWFVVDGFSHDKQNTDTDKSSFTVNKLSTLRQDLTTSKKIFNSALKKKWTSIKPRSGSKDYTHNKRPISIYCKSQRNSFQKAYLEKRRRPSELTQYRNFILNIAHTNRKRQEGRKIHNIEDFYAQKYEPLTSLDSIEAEEPPENCIPSEEDECVEGSTCFVNRKPYVKGIVRKLFRKEEGKSKRSSNDRNIEMNSGTAVKEFVIIKRRQFECFVCIENLASS